MLIICNYLYRDFNSGYQTTKYGRENEHHNLSFILRLIILQLSFKGQFWERAYACIYVNEFILAFMINFVILK